MPRRRTQAALPDTLVAGGRRPVYCRRCRRELTDPASRSRGWGPECDPLRHPPTPDTGDIDQDTIPGT